MERYSAPGGFIMHTRVSFRTVKLGGLAIGLTICALAASGCSHTTTNTNSVVLTPSQMDEAVKNKQQLKDWDKNRIKDNQKALAIVQSQPGLTAAQRARAEALLNANMPHGQ
jgi:hypothetical protein